MSKKHLNLTVFVFLSMILTACYQPAHTQYRSPTISYQFDEPRDYCQRTLSATNIEMYCEEGEINIVFITVDANLTMREIIKDYITLETFELEEADGKRSQILLGRYKNTELTEGNVPDLIAIIPMDNSSLYAVAVGYYTSEVEDNFFTTFKNLVVTFEP